MKTPTWLFRGTRAEILSPIRAFFIAPLLALIPIGASFVMKISSGSTLRMEEVVVISLFTLLTAYGTTLIVGIPWYLTLARYDVAGLIPMMISSVIPPAFVYLRARGHQYTDTGLFASLFFICGLLISAGFWKIARSEWE